MKTLFIAFFVLASFINIEANQEIQIIKATFDKYENGSYFFTDEKDNTVEFRNIEETASDKYDLTIDTYQGKNFKVMYTNDTEI